MNEAKLGVPGRRLVYVPLSEEAQEALIELAMRKKRLPKDQAALLLEEALGLRKPEDAG